MNETAKVSAEEKRSWTRADTDSDLDSHASTASAWSCLTSTGDLTAATFHCASAVGLCMTTAVSRCRRAFAIMQFQCQGSRCVGAKSSTGEVSKIPADSKA